MPSLPYPMAWAQRYILELLEEAGDGACTLAAHAGPKLAWEGLTQASKLGELSFIPQSCKSETFTFVPCVTFEMLVML